jgi:phage-related holin
MERLSELIVKFCPAFLLACYADIKFLVTLIMSLLIIDTITAIYKAFKFRVAGEQWFHYKKLSSTIEKFLAYSLALIVAWIITKTVGLDFGLDSFVAGYIAIYESISIFTHLSKITNMKLFYDIIIWLKEKADFKKYFKTNSNSNLNTTENEFDKSECR